MTDKEIRDAVERFKAWVHWKNMYEVVDADFLTDLNAILDIVQRYLSASSVMPSKPTGSEVNEDGQPISDVWVEGYNSAIDDCTLSLMKKCEGLEEVINKVAFRLPHEDARCYNIQYLPFLNELATAIRKHLEVATADDNHTKRIRND